MNLRKRHKSFVILATGLFLIVSLNSVPSGSSVPPSPPALDLDEIQALEEIETWLTGTRDGFEAITPRDLTRAAASRPLAFELFRDYTDEAVRRRQLLAVPYGDEISEVASEYHIDGLLLASVVEVESGFRPDVVSPQGAVGLMQVMPTTGSRYGARDLMDPRTNLTAGTSYFADLLDKYGGSLDLALAAYNAGPGNVARYGGIPPFRETRRYVDRVLSVYVDHHRSAWEASGAKDLILFQ
jgi:hypothetical protein